MQPNRKLLAILLAFLFMNTYGQKNITNQSLVWYTYFQTLQFNDKLWLNSEVVERRFLNPDAQHQFLIRSHLHKKLGIRGWEASVGMCLFLQNPNSPNATIILTMPELRPHIQMTYKQQLKLVTLEHRYRLEARFFHNTNQPKTELEDGYDFGNFRFRYRLQATIPILKLGIDRAFKLKIADEIHANIGSKIGSNVFDQNRIFIAANVDVLPNLAVEMGYMNWFQEKADATFYNRNILQFSVFHKIFAHKNKKLNLTN
jgi:hypothetical protein